MKEVVVLSGKGGTGKTSVLAALAHLASIRGSVVMADADVDAANLGLVLAPTTLVSHEFASGKVAVVADDRCSGCGACLEACRFGAVVVEATLSNGRAHYRVDPLACEGCAACFHRCPTGAIAMREKVAGRWSVANTRFGTLVHAHLFAGQENSGKLVTQVKQQARELATAQGASYLLVDGPPGIGCPVIAACAGSNLALLVAEPTVASLHDLERILATTRHFDVPAVVCLNKCDLNPGRAREIEAFCAEQGIELVGRIPFDTAVTEAMVAGRAITECNELRLTNESDGQTPGISVARELASVWAQVEVVLERRDARQASAR